MGAGVGGGDDGGDDATRHDILRLKRDNLRLAERLQRSQQELLAVQDTNRRLVGVVTQHGLDAARLLVGSNHAEVGSVDEIGAALEVLEVQTKVCCVWARPRAPARACVCL